MDQFKQVFVEEAEELLSSLEDLLLNLEDSPHDRELLDAVFRVMHTIKGSAAMFDFKGIVDFTHVVESVLDRVRNDEMVMTKEIIDLTLISRDHILAMLDSPGGLSRELSLRSREILDQFPMIESVEGKGDVHYDPRSGVDSKSPLTLFRIRFKPDRDIFYSGTNILALLTELGTLGEMTVIAHGGDIPPLDAIEPEKSYVVWEILLTTTQDENALRDVFIFVESQCELDISVVTGEKEMADDPEDHRLGEILVDRKVITENDLSAALGQQKPLGQIMTETGLVSDTDIDVALEQQKTERSLRQRFLGDRESTIRVKSEKLDSLVDSVGELVTAQARLSQVASQYNDTSLKALAELIERLSTELRDNAMGLRMIPIGTTFSRFRRLVRDLSQGLGKEVTMETDGGETELDKSVIEKLNDPLVHLIRNAIDHGLEGPEVRMEKGKNREGRVSLSASYSGANVVIEIRDDGAGLDRDKILAKALEKNLISRDADLSDKDVFKLILQPGFSTASEITDVSGRGVGMDVVSREIESLGGSIFIDSKEGKGTTISLSLPLTLAIIEGLLVQNGNEKFVIPLASVQACLEIDEAERNKHKEKRLFEFRDKMLPYIRLRELFFDDSQLPEREHLVVTQTENGIFGIVVDEVIGDYQTVIKNLGRLYKNLPLITGATILGDGTMALILDLNKITTLAREESIPRGVGTGAGN